MPVSGNATKGSSPTTAMCRLSKIHHKAHVTATQAHRLAGPGNPLQKLIDATTTPIAGEAGNIHRDNLSYKIMRPKNRRRPSPSVGKSFVTAKLNAPPFRLVGPTPRSEAGRLQFVVHERPSAPIRFG